MVFQENIPIYLQIANDIKEQIICGKILEGSKLSSVREYSLMYEVTTLTIQRAIQLLESEKIVETKKGIGSFVNIGIQSILKNKMVDLQVKDFIQGMKNMGVVKEEILHLVKEELEVE